MSKDLVTTVDTTSIVKIVRAPKRSASNKNIIVDRDLAIKCNALTTTSAQIRFLQKCGYKSSQIASILNILPQHAYNVMNQVLKSNR